MGACMSSPGSGIEVSEEDKRLHREAEKALKEVSRPLGLRCSLSNLVTGEIEDGLTSQGLGQKTPSE